MRMLRKIGCDRRGWANTRIALAGIAAAMAMPGSALAASRTFANDYEIATFCEAAALIGVPPPTSNVDPASPRMIAAVDLARHWFEQAGTNGLAMGKDSKSILADIARVQAELADGFKDGQAPFYDLTTCEPPDRKVLWLSVPATIDTVRPYTPRGGPMRLDRLADDREVAVYHSRSGRLRPDYARLSARSAFVGDVAILAFRHALAEALARPNRPAAGQFGLLLGEALRARDIGAGGANVEFSIEAFRTATENLDPPSMDWASAQAGLCFAYLTRVLGDRVDNIERAIAACEQALPVFDRAETRQQWAGTQLVLAGAFHDRARGSHAQNLENAIAADKAALSARSRSADPTLWATTEVNLGVHLSDRLLGDRQENIEAALAAFSSAAEVVTRDAAPDAWAVLQNNMAPLYLERERGGLATNQSLAIDRLNAVLAMPGTIGPLRSSVFFNLGQAYRRRITGDTNENIGQSVRYYREALLGDASGARWPVTVGRLLGNALIALGRYDEARDALKIAARAAEREIGLGIDEAQLRDVIADAGDIYTLSAFAAAKTGDPRGALMLLSEGKARLLFASLAANQLDLPKGDLATLRTLRADVQREEAGLEALVLNDRSGGSTSADSVSRLEQLRSQILMLYDRGSRSAWQQPPLRLVVRKGALVAPVVTEFGSVVLVATAAGKVSAHDVSDLTRKRMTAMVNGGGDGPVRGWSASTQAPDALDSSLAAMQSMLGTSLGAGLQLALDQAGIARGAAIVILPDGADALLPLSLATNAQSGRMLLEDYTISFVPSIAALGASANRVRQARRRSLALLMPPEGANLDYAPIEGRLVEAMFQSAPHDAWNGATKDSLLQGLGPRTYWHFSTHGTFDWNDPRQSGVLIGPDHAMLTLADLLGARQRIGAPRLVVLSACDTGLTDINRNPDEFTGLPTGFLLAGAAGVVASLWPVNDLSTTLLMSRFYELHLVSGRSPAEALKAAQLWLRDATVVNLQAYVEAKQASGAISADQAGLIQDDLTLVQAQMGPLGRPFAAPRFWGAFVLYGQ